MKWRHLSSDKAISNVIIVSPPDLFTKPMRAGGYLILKNEYNNRDNDYCIQDTKNILSEKVSGI